MAAFIPEAKIHEVRERTDLVALISRNGVELKRSGRMFKGCCPFHQEKTASFHVWPEDKHFYCFGCNASGDAISFLQRLHGKSFVDVVRELAQECSVDLESDLDPAYRERLQVKEATDVAAAYYAAQLREPSGAVARTYLKERGLTGDIARRFGLGWAPPGWENLAGELAKRGLEEHGERAGLIAPRPQGKGYFDMFRQRVIIPIRSPEGRTIAFGGRLLGDGDGPKYLNSRETRLYNKSEVLFALDVARNELRKRRSAVLCEGYFDAIALHQAGIEEAVALCSTNLSPAHLTLLQKLNAREVVFLLDGDEAGRQAIERLAATVLSQGVAARVALLPAGDDPDTFARRVGGPAVRTLLEQATPLSQYLLQSALPEGHNASFEAKMQALSRLAPIANGLPAGLQLTTLTQSIATHFGWEAAQVRSRLQGKRPSAASETRPAAAAAPAVPLDPFEVMYLAFILADPALLGKDTHMARDDLTSLEIRAVVGALQAGTSPSDALYDSSEDLKNQLASATRKLPREADLPEAFQKFCLRLKIQVIDARLRRHGRLASMSPGASTDITDELRDLSEERNSLFQAKARLERALRAPPESPGR